MSRTEEFNVARILLREASNLPALEVGAGKLMAAQLLGSEKLMLAALSRFAGLSREPDPTKREEAGRKYMEGSAIG
jgi:hypothetical protein